MEGSELPGGGCGTEMIMYDTTIKGTVNYDAFVKVNVCVCSQLIMCQYSVLQCEVLALLWL